MIICGFHAIEEKVRSFSKNIEAMKTANACIYYSKPGPRVKKILESARKIGLVCKETDESFLDNLVSSLDKTARDHRGIVLQMSASQKIFQNFVDLDDFLTQVSEWQNSLVVILDSVTDPHNVGAIMRSCDQFSVDLLILPERNSAKDGEVINRSSSGAASWVKTSVVTNLVRAVEKLKKAGFWIYGADAGGTNCVKTNLLGKVVLVMGSEGYGIGRLLQENCDAIISIPTSGKLDSLNVSVAAGVLLYEVNRQRNTTQY